MKHQDNHGTWSSWSTETSFSTKTSADRWAVIIGVSDYRNFLPATWGLTPVWEMHDLHYPADDAQGLYDDFTPIWGAANVKLLVNSSASRAGIKDAMLNWLDGREDADDTVLVYFSGHGAQYEGHEYLLPWDSLTSSYANDIRDDEFAGWLAQLESQNLVVILDSCNSGGFVQDLTGSSRTVLTACSTDESAWESASLDHGVFSYYLLDALGKLSQVDANDDYRISAEELFAYAQPKVQDYKSSQHPQMYDGSSSQLDLFYFAVFDASPQIASVTVDGKIYSGTALPATFCWAPGSAHHVGVQSQVDSGVGTRYLFNAWSDNSTLCDRELSQGGDYVADYVTQYKLTVDCSPSGITTVSGDGWYSEGASVVTGSAPVDIDGSSPGVRYHFLNWTVDGEPVTGNAASVTVDAPHTAVATYTMQYYLTVQSEIGNPQGTGWYASGTMATVSVASPIGKIIRHVFSGWSGDSSDTTATASILVDGPKSLTATWRTEYMQLYILIAGVLLVAGIVAGVILLWRKRHGLRDLPEHLSDRFG